MRNATLCLLIKDGKIFLGKKKRGFGEGKLNGYGGKQAEGEDIEETAVRELFEESGVKVSNDDLNKVGEIDFYFPPGEKADKYNQKVHTYIVKNWSGKLRESEEMTVEEFPLDEIPYEEMWDTDRYWMKPILNGEKIKGVIHFNDDFETTKSFNYGVVESFS
jgi:8-oxo-dGTP pyrophosphatase MutT (NUDIX family)